MTYTHLTTNELTIIAHSFVQKLKAYRVAQMINRWKPFIAFIVTWKPVPQLLIIKITSNVVAENVLSCHWLNSLISTTKLPRGWTPDTIIGRAERPISCNQRTLYRMFERGQFGFDVRSLPMRGKRHPNGYVERHGKAGQLGRSIHERAEDFPHYATEFGHLEADTVQGKKHQGAVMTLTER